MALQLATSGVFAGPPAEAASRSEATLCGPDVTVGARVVDGQLRERYLARRGETWVEVAR